MGVTCLLPRALSRPNDSHLGGRQPPGETIIESPPNTTVNRPSVPGGLGGAEALPRLGQSASRQGVLGGRGTPLMVNQPSVPGGLGGRKPSPDLANQPVVANRF